MSLMYMYWAGKVQEKESQVRFSGLMTLILLLGMNMGLGSTVFE